MRMVLTFLVPALFLLGCSNEPVAWEDKTPEQQRKERQYMRSCYTKQIKTQDWKICDAEFEKEFGYPYNAPSRQKE